MLFKKDPKSFQNFMSFCQGYPLGIHLNLSRSLIIEGIHWGKGSASV